ncbi:hypothetical protein RJ639_031489 [Escallonia herrerae]|uniref:Magnesium transporter n=1 Tax=Escallonia herrerae TaxID=1293975 RepID=A0AA89BMF8_9ASTE|nr:hypothetical protein RJ639_031489 [Escallonia herrerae]
MAGDGFIVPVESSLKKKMAVSRSWILLDQSGQGTILDLDKYAIMRRVPINARDLRILDPLLSYPSTILGRERAIVLNLEHIKAIITTEEVLLRDPLDDNVVPIVEELKRRLPLVNAIGQGEDEEHSGMQNDVASGDENEFPFEFRALEVALESICSFLDARTRELETAAYPALDELTSKISSRNLDRVRKLKSAMTRLTNRVQKASVRDEFEQLLDDDDDMADLYLSRKLLGAPSPISGNGVANWSPVSPTIGSKLSKTSRASAVTTHGEPDVEELEMLLEAYFTQIEGTLNKLTTLREYIDDTEDYINIQVTTGQSSKPANSGTAGLLPFPNKNSLHFKFKSLDLELFLCSGTVCLSVYSLVAAIFGMNIPYPWREGHGYLFKWVVILTGIASGTIFFSIMTYARHKEFPFEFRALEVALESICSFLDARTRELETAAYPALDELTSKISSRNLDRVRKLKSAMTRLTNRVQKASVRDEFEQLLDDDDDMADLYLSRKLLGAPSPISGNGVANWSPVSPTIGSKLSKTSRASAVTTHGEPDVEELEMLLEAYFTQIEGTLNKLTTLREYIDDTEDYINIQLDNHRNQLIQVVILTGIASGTIFFSIMTYARHKGLVGS